MPITVHCDCQQEFRVKDELAGKRIKCPYCEQAVTVPEGEQFGSSSISTGHGYAMPETQMPAVETSPYPSSDYPTSDYGGAHYAPSQQFAGGHPHAAAQPSPENPFDSPQMPQIADSQLKPAGGVNTGAVLSGVGMMVGGVILGLIMLAGGRISIFPILLFIFGLISFFKGITGSA